MENIAQNVIRFKNAESPFTELFSLFQRHDVLSKVGEIEEIEIVNQHVNNAMETLFQGLQTVGQLIGYLQDAESISRDLMSIGYFVSVVCNLLEALNILRVDAVYAMRHINN
jgi:hypothetical protein